MNDIITKHLTDNSSSFEELPTNIYATAVSFIRLIGENINHNFNKKGDIRRTPAWELLTT